jgi:hypothetical protein
MTFRPSARIGLLSILVLICMIFATTPKSGQAFDGSTWAAWHSTWHAPNALDTRLRPYFIPRLPGHCDRDVYSDEYGYVTCTGNVEVNEQGVAYALPCETRDPLPGCAACLSVRSERLGQIPNDLELAGTGAVAAPGR